MRFRSAGRCLPPLVLTLAAFVLAAARAHAQTSTPVTIGADALALRTENEDRASGLQRSPGVGAWLAVGLTRRLAIETRVAWFPEEQKLRDGYQGGQTFELAAGVRGDLLLRPRYAIYGALLPGLVHVTDTVTRADFNDPTSGATLLAMTAAIGVELYSSSRWSARVEFNDMCWVVPGLELFRSAPNEAGAVAIAVRPASVRATWQVRGGVGYRFGSPRPSTIAPESPVAGRWEVGSHVSSWQYAPPAGASDMVRNAGVGAFVSYRLLEYLHADGAVTGFLRMAPEISNFAGGHLLQAVAGVKIGPRRDRMGVFLKARAGVASDSAVLTELDHQSGTRRTGRSTSAVLDIGGVFEAYLARRMVVRVDGGNISTFNHATRFTLDGYTFDAEPSEPASNSIQMTVGVGWRFR